MGGGGGIVIQSEYAQRGCNLRQIESRYLLRHILRYSRTYTRVLRGRNT